jgi:hypothetical protein
MKTRYEESFLFPQGREDFGRSLLFPQGNLRGLGSTTEQENLTYSFIFPQGETEDFGRALMFPQGQLHGLRGLGAAPSEAEIKTAGATFGLDPDDPSQRNLIISEIEKRKVQKAADDAYDAWIAARNAAAPAALAILQYDSTGRATDASIQAANAFQAQQAAPQEAAFVAAEQKVEAVVQANYAVAAAIPNTIEEIVARAREGASITAKNEGFDANIQKAAADAAEMSARRGDSYGDQMRAGWEASYAAKSRADAIAAQQASIAAGVAQAAAAAKAAAAAQAAAAEQMAAGVKAAQAATAAAAAAAAASTPKTIVSVNNTAGTVTTTNPTTGTVTTTSPTTGATTTANVVTGAVTVTTATGQTVAGTGSVTAGNTSTTVNTATKTVTTTNTSTGATTVTNAATGQSQTGTAQPTTYILDFYDNQFWLKTSAGAAVSNGSSDWKTPAAYLASSGITLAQTTLTPAASVKFANNQGVTVQANSAGGTTTTNPTTGTVTTTNPTTGTVTTTNTTTGTTTTTTPATGTTTVTTSQATDTGKLALFALLGVLLLRGAVR